MESEERIILNERQRDKQRKKASAKAKYIYTTGVNYDPSLIIVKKFL